MISLEYILSLVLLAFFSLFILHSIWGLERGQSDFFKEKLDYSGAFGCSIANNYIYSAQGGKLDSNCSGFAENVLLAQVFANPFTKIFEIKGRGHYG